MVSALFQSRPRRTGGTRSLEASGVNFGWQVIQNMYQREVERIRAGQVTRVPKLRESFVVRDSWTRLNVMPFKVMQVCAHRLLTTGNVVARRGHQRTYRICH
jgi:hypothetical protein